MWPGIQVRTFAMSDPVALFMELGLSEAKAKETAKNAKLAAQLTHVAGRAKAAAGGKDLASLGALLYTLASKMKPQSFSVHADLLTDYVSSGKVDSEVRLNAALDFLLKNPDAAVDVKKFEASCGVGVVVTPEQVEKAVEEAIAGEREGSYNFVAIGNGSWKETIQERPSSSFRAIKEEVFENEKKRLEDDSNCHGSPHKIFLSFFSPKRFGLNRFISAKKRSCNFQKSINFEYAISLCGNSYHI